MKRFLICCTLIALAATALPAQEARGGGQGRGGGAPNAGPRQPDPVTPEIAAAIEAAVPSVAHVKPARPRKVLLMNVNVNLPGRRPDVHVSLLRGNHAIIKLGEMTGAYTTVLSTNVEDLNEANLAQYDAIVFNNTTGVLTEDPKLRAALLGFVRNGKGFVAFHAGAAATFVQHPVYDQFPEFGEMVGGYENGGHPWGPNETITVRVEDKASPLTKMFNGWSFDTQDEVYQLADYHSRDQLHVLLSIDTDRSDFDNPRRRFWPARKADRQFPMTFIKKYGNGRVFNSLFGHNATVFQSPVLMSHFLAGIQYAIGDLKADDSPNSPLPAAAPPTAAPPAAR